MAWQKTDAPRKKADYVWKYLFLNEAVPVQWWLGKTAMPKFRPGKNEIVRITRRLNSEETAHTGNDVSWWGKMRVLKVEYTCHVCDAHHSYYIPEMWIQEGLAVFVAQCSEESHAI